MDQLLSAYDSSSDSEQDNEKNGPPTHYGLIPMEKTSLVEHEELNDLMVIESAPVGRKSEIVLLNAGTINTNTVPLKQLASETENTLNISKSCGNRFYELEISELLQNLVCKVAQELEGTEVQCIGHWTYDYGYREESSSDSSASESDSPDSENETSSEDTDSESSLTPMDTKSKGPKPYSTVKTKGELGLTDLPPIEDLYITVPEADTHLIGIISSIVQSIVVVQTLEKESPLDLDSILFLKGGMPLGKIFDVFGRVSAPFYSVRFNTPQEIADRGLTPGQEVYSAPDHKNLTAYVFTENLIRQKGSDASWTDNNEPPDEFLEFSDDEAEKFHRLKVKAKRKFGSADVEFVQEIINTQKERRKRRQRQDIIHPPRFQNGSSNRSNGSTSGGQHFYNRGLNSTPNFTRPLLTSPMMTNPGMPFQTPNWQVPCPGLPNRWPPNVGQNQLFSGDPNPWAGPSFNHAAQNNGSFTPWPNFTIPPPILHRPPNHAQGPHYLPSNFFGPPPPPPSNQNQLRFHQTH